MNTIYFDPALQNIIFLLSIFVLVSFKTILKLKLIFKTIVGVFVSAVVSILIFLGQNVCVYQSYNGGLWSPPQITCTESPN